MFSTRLKGGKAFATEKNVVKLKKLLLKSKNLSKNNKMKIKGNKIIEEAKNDMNKINLDKYDIDPNTIVQKYNSE